MLSLRLDHKMGAGQSSRTVQPEIDWPRAYWFVAVGYVLLSTLLALVFLDIANVLQLGENTFPELLVIATILVLALGGLTLFLFAYRNSLNICIDEAGIRQRRRGGYRFLSYDEIIDVQYESSRGFLKLQGKGESITVPLFAYGNRKDIEECLFRFRSMSNAAG